jgi:class 3 adenylate cyclase/tetratricopeptide (TPR) repeat protein
MAQSIADWLADIGLDRHSDLFAENRIDLDVLPELTERDLETMDIPLGDRKRIMRAIAALQPVPDQDSEAGDARVDIGVTGHLRQLTVCFVDLVGSVALSAALDLEDYEELVRRYHVTCTRLITAHDGFVAQYAGDGVVAYFGYPRAREDDPEQAVLAAVAILREVPSISGKQAGGLSARAGIATGDVLISGPIYEGVKLTKSAMGQVPNLAARLQTVASPGSVVVSETTQRLLGSQFVCDDAGRHQLKGFPNPVQAYRVRDIRPTTSRFEMRQRGASIPLVGREEEMGQLQRRWERASAGHGNVVLLSGEPGIGKSRLAQELAGRAAQQPHLRLSFQCSAHYSGTALYPVAAYLEHAAGLRSDDSPSEKLAKLRNLLSDPTENPESLYLFARLLSLRVDMDDAAFAQLSSQRIKERTTEALIGRVLRIAERKPVLMIVEDLHWIDPTTRELIDHFVDRIADKRVLLVCTFRRDFVPPWVGLPQVTRIDVNRLSRTESAVIVASLMAGRETAQASVEAIVEKTDGVPLFVEELTKAALEWDPSANPDRSGRRYAGAPGLPSTLKDSLMARLDRLPFAEKVMPVGAAIGRSFSYAVLAAVTGLTDEALRPALAQLVDAELLFQRGEPPETTYTFKHALVQDVAYESMLKSRMRELHKRIAGTIVESFPEVAETRPELVAQHLSRAMQPAQALPYWERAAEVAIARSANAEAVAHLEAALAENAQESDAAARVHREIHLRERLCVPLEARSWGSEDIAANLNRLHDLVAEHGDEAQLFTILHGLCGECLINGDIEPARDYARRMEAIAKRSGDAAMTVLSRHALGMADFFLGAFSEAIGHFEAAIRQRGEADGATLRKYYVADPEVVGRSMQAWARALSDDGGEESAAAVADALALAEASEHDFTRAYGFSILASASQSRGDARAALDLASRARQLSRQVGFTYWEAWSQIVYGWATAVTGDAEAGIARLGRGLELYRKTGSRQIVPYAKALLAEACLKAERAVEGLAAIEEIDEMRAHTSVRFYDRRIETLRHALRQTTAHGDTTQRP